MSARHKIGKGTDMDTIEYEGFKIEIEQDDSPESPREWGNMGKMICFHGRYQLGDKDHGYDHSDYSGWDEMKEALEKKATVVLPVYLYDHSGLAISITPFSCRWDSGQIGFIIATREDICTNFSVKRVTKRIREDVRKSLKGEIEAYGQYLSGDVWQYSIEDKDGNHIDSCCGMYGREYCEQAAKEACPKSLPQESVFA
jgi:hypothetical protein